MVRVSILQRNVLRIVAERSSINRNKILVYRGTAPLFHIRLQPQAVMREPIVPTRKLTFGSGDATVQSGSHMSRFRPTVVALAALLIAVQVAAADEAPEVWPTHAWRESTPEAQGLDSNTLADALEFVRDHHIRLHSLLIERRGSIVVDAYVFPFADHTLHDLASVTKSVTSTLVGVAIGEERLPGVDAPVLPLLSDPPPQPVDPRKAAMTIGNLLSMTSGLDCHSDHGEITLRKMRQSPHWARFMIDQPMTSDPGTTFEYCSGGVHMLSAVLSKATGASAFEYARHALFAPLGIGAAVWPADTDGNSYGWGDLHLQPRDMAKLGYLWLHRGRWDDKQIVPAGYLSAATAVHSRAQWGEEYGFGFWLYPRREPPIYEANGRGGQRISVIPSKEMVVVMTGSGFEPGDVGAFIGKAIRSDDALPPNPVAYTRLLRAIADAARPPPAHTPVALPTAARILARQGYTLDANAVGLGSVSFTFHSASLASVRLIFADGHCEDADVGLDGIPRLTTISPGRTVALRGWWEGTVFALDHDQVADINAFTIRFVPSAEHIAVQVVQQAGTGSLDARFGGRRAPQPPKCMVDSPHDQSGG